MGDRTHWLAHRGHVRSEVALGTGHRLNDVAIEEPGGSARRIDAATSAQIREAILRCFVPVAEPCQDSDESCHAGALRRLRCASTAGSVGGCG